MIRLFDLLPSDVFFNDTATTEIYTLSLHDALPISATPSSCESAQPCRGTRTGRGPGSAAAAASDATRSTDGPPASRPALRRDRKSTRLNSSHANISYAVFCLTKNISPDYHTT